MTQYPTSPPPPVQSQGAPGMAIAALILGLLGLCFPPLGLIALILGIIALAKSGSPGAEKGRGFAIAGVVMGGLALVVTPLLIAILLPALGAARNTARRMQNSTQLRGIHQGLVTYSFSNNNFFPGIHTNGEVQADGPETGNSGDGNTPQARYWLLMEGDFFWPEYAISPSETEPIWAWTQVGPVTADNYSYAMLQFSTTGPVNENPPNGPATYALDPYSLNRANEWGQTLNSQAIVLSDRNIGTDTSFNIQSIHSDPGSWRGSVLWNDNHVGFENSHLFDTKYGSGNYLMQDHLFEDANGSDALMVWD